MDSNINIPYPPKEDYSCSICLELFSNPVRLTCNHLFDFKCICDWTKQSMTCPLDRTVVDMTKIKYCPDVLNKIKKMQEVVFTFSFLTDKTIVPISIDIDEYEYVQSLKIFIAKCLHSAAPSNEEMTAWLNMEKKDNLPLKKYDDEAKFDGGYRPNMFVLLLKRETGPSLLLNATTKFSRLINNKVLIKGEIHEIIVLNKVMYRKDCELACDHCYSRFPSEKSLNCTYTDYDWWYPGLPKMFACPDQQ